MVEDYKVNEKPVAIMSILSDKLSAYVIKIHLNLN